MQAISKHIGIRRRFGQSSRCRGNARKKIALRPAVSTGYGFLRHRFQPVWNGEPLQGGQTEIESAFYQSLSYLEGLHKFKTLRCSNKIFPFNIAADFETAQERLEKIDPTLTLFISMDDQQNPCICTAEAYNTDCTLFYIPVKPLYILAKNRRKKKTADLLLSLFSYLHIVLKVPYYRDNNTFLYGCYQVMQEQFDQYEDEEPDPDIRIKFKELATVGNRLNKKIKNLHHLEQLGNRVRKFKAADKLDEEILSAAKTALELSQQYPNQSIFEHIPEQLLHPQEFDRITSDQYISFYWADEDDYISTWVFEYVNGCFEHCGAIDDPVAYQVFNSRQNQPAHDLKFVTTVFEMIDKLCNALNDVR